MSEDNERSAPPQPRQRRKTRFTVLANLGWVLSGCILTILLISDPLDLHPVDTWLHDLLSHEQREGEPQGAEGRGNVLFYRHPMDPTITSPVPAKDEMGMDYLPVYADQPQGGSRGAVLFYRHPMDPTITSPVPAKDEMGMDYLPVYSDGAAGADSGETVVAIDPVMVQNMNVQVATVEKRDITHHVRTVGYLDYDQQRMVSITTKYSGWIEKVHVNYVGEPVSMGQPLFEIYSPELVQTEQELLSALEYARRIQGAPEEVRRRAEDLVEAARTRLSYWDITAQQVDQLERQGKVVRTLTVTAPTSGVVMMRMPGLEGMAVKPGMELFHIVGVSNLWLSVEVFEGQLAFLNVGSRAQVTLSYFPGETFTGRVRFIEPEVSEKTRTVPLMVEVPNRNGKLKAGMFATVVFEPVVGEQVVTVPSLAILRTGERNIVIVELGPGRFAPREIVLGHEGPVYAEVLEGLEAGERIVTSAQFLIDSEANLREAIQKMIAQRQQELESPAAQEPGAGHQPETRSNDPGQHEVPGGSGRGNGEGGSAGHPEADHAQ